jgi:hypothetical protein
MPATRAISRALRDEALNLLDRRGSILELAREISEIMRRENIRGAVIGGVAVVLHGHTRSTTDVDVFIDQPLQSIAEQLIREGFVYDKMNREFTRGGVPLHLVTRDQFDKPLKETVEIEGVTTVGLADLIEMKLASGTKNVLRAQDLADVIGLMRRNRLEADFANLFGREARTSLPKAAHGAGARATGMNRKSVFRHHRLDRRLEAFQLPEVFNG